MFWLNIYREATTSTLIHCHFHFKHLLYWQTSGLAKNEEDLWATMTYVISISLAEEIYVVPP